MSMLWFWILFYLDTSSNQSSSFSYVTLPLQWVTHRLVCSGRCSVSKLNFSILDKTGSWKSIRMFEILGWSDRLNFQSWLVFINIILYLKSEKQRNTCVAFIVFSLHMFSLTLDKHYMVLKDRGQRPIWGWFFFSHLINIHVIHAYRY